MKEKKEKEMISLLQNTFLFQNISEEEIKQVLADDRAETVFFEKGTIIYDKLHYRKSIGILLQGEAAVLKEPGENKTILFNILKKGDTFGGAALYHKSHEFIGTIKAQKDCLILFLNGQILQSLFLMDIQFAENYISFLSHAVVFLNKKIDGFTLSDTERKVYAYLKKNQKGQKVVLPYSYSSLAEALNMGRASLYRVLDLLSEQGKIERKGREIYLLDRESFL